MTDRKLSGRIVKLRGIATGGLGESRFFTDIPWVKRQFLDKLGIDPYPGTFNIMVLPEDIEGLNLIKQARGIEIVPEDMNFCPASSFPVLVNGQVEGALIMPLVPNYPPAQLEIISSENIRQALSLKDGDRVEIAVNLVY